MQRNEERGRGREKSINVGNVIFATLIAAVVIFGIGVFLATRPSKEYRFQREVQKIESAGRLTLWRDVFLVAGGGLLVIALGGSVAIFLYGAWFRVNLISHKQGLFPIIRGKAGGQTFYHDPNRQLAGSVAYGEGQAGVEAQHLLPQGAEDLQAQITAQAQAVQVVAAARKDEETEKATRRLVERVTKRTRTGQRLPKVEVVEGEIVDADDRFLLAAIRQDWEDEGGKA